MTAKDNLLKTLIEHVLKDAEFLLRKDEEFYPFAYTHKNGTFAPLNIYSGNDQPKPSTHLAELEEALAQKHTSYAIGINSTFKPANGSETLDIIEIRVTVNNEQYQAVAVPYKTNGEGLDLGAMFEI